jgi:hypothetical protein
MGIRWTWKYLIGTHEHCMHTCIIRSSAGLECSGRLLVGLGYVRGLWMRDNEMDDFYREWSKIMKNSAIMGNKNVVCQAATGRNNRKALTLICTCICNLCFQWYQPRFPLAPLISVGRGTDVHRYNYATEWEGHEVIRWRECFLLIYYVGYKTRRVSRSEEKQWVTENWESIRVPSVDLVGCSPKKIHQWR